MTRVIAFALVLAGCIPDPPVTLGAQCDLNTDCAPGLVCRLERCRRWCSTSRDCRLRAACVYVDGLGTCLLEDELDCTADSDCPGDLVCSFERCVNECEEDRDCPPGSTCEGRPDGPPACVDPFESRCVRPSDCPDDLVCARDARCRPECLTSYDCLDDEACVGDPGACLPVAIDGGMSGDGGGLDAGSDASMDAARPDGGSDAGGGDADVGDAGVLECARSIDCPSAPNAMLGCALPSGRCIVESCTAGFADCDFGPENGCEVNVEADADNCGGCGIRCLGAGRACTARTCDEIVDVAAGGLHQCYVRASGSAFCWGANLAGQLGDGTAMSRTAPVPVRGLTDAVEIVAGWLHSCARRRDGSLVCWGENGNGQLGSGTTTSALEPSPVVLPEGVVSMGTGEEHTCAVLAGGDLLCWGARTSFQLGDNSSTGNALLPQPPMTTLDYRAVTAGGNHSCAIRTDGTVACWGSAGATGIGIGAGTVRTPPDAPIAFVSDAVAIDSGPGSVGAATTCAMASTGELWCWGSNAGVGSPTASLFAVRPTGLARVRAFGVGNNAVCAVAIDRRLFCWGDTPADTGLTDVELVEVGGSQIIASRRNGELYSFLFSATPTPALAPGFD